ncbi:MAG: AmmeMemoRadiSam system radical SAM enzyme [Planctomycetes bacterium]|nr:AmmeMemoRadiSam system radical SAM enzyme [Planctomycetota bacterium]
MVSLDPVEKLPLAHFLPGEPTLALGTGGCNLRCQYCQNWRQTQARPEEVASCELAPAKALETAGGRGVRNLAFAYTEPVASCEYSYDLASLARERGVRTVVATALSIEEQPLRELARVVDAFAVGLKGFDERFYEVVLGSSLTPVLRALEVLKESGTWFELETLVVPTFSDDPDLMRRQCRWVKENLGRDVPVHFGRFVPEYRMTDLPRTPVSTLERCVELAREEGLRHAYIFNVAPHEAQHTRCPRCEKVLIERVGMRVTAQRMDAGRCTGCREPIPGVWA